MDLADIQEGTHDVASMLRSLYTFVHYHNVALRVLRWSMAHPRGDVPVVFGRPGKFAGDAKNEYLRDLRKAGVSLSKTEYFLQCAASLRETC